MIVIETERLNICHHVPEDAPFILEIMNSPGWLKFIGDRKVRTLEDARSYLVDKMIPPYEKQGFGFYRCELKESGQPVGTCGLVNRDSLEDIDIGYALLPQFEGKGYAFEATSAIYKYAKSTLQLGRIVAITVPYNNRSIHLLEKLGLHFVKTMQLEGDDEPICLYADE